MIFWRLCIWCLIKFNGTTLVQPSHLWLFRISARIVSYRVLLVGQTSISQVPIRTNFTQCIKICNDNTLKIVLNKKVLLRERKRHTARCAASARYADLSWTGGCPIQPGEGGVYPIQSQIWTWDGVHPPSGPRTGYPPPPIHLGWGTPLSRCELTN